MLNKHDFAVVILQISTIEKVTKTSGSLVATKIGEKMRNGKKNKEAKKTIARPFKHTVNKKIEP